MRALVGSQGCLERSSTLSAVTTSAPCCRRTSTGAPWRTGGGITTSASASAAPAATSRATSAPASAAGASRTPLGGERGGIDLFAGDERTRRDDDVAHRQELGLRPAHGARARLR